MIFRQLFQERFTLGIVEHDWSERDWLRERVQLDHVTISEFSSLAEVREKAQSERLDILLVSLAGMESPCFEKLQSLRQELPRCALILLDDFDDEQLSHHATRVH